MPLFQSTLPVGGATDDDESVEDKLAISIHAPRGGSDWWRGITSIPTKRFQSTLPVGGATGKTAVAIRATVISIHAPRGGSDSKDAQFWVHIFGEGI